MQISMHSASVHIFAKMFENMLGWLNKAQAHAEARNFDPGLFLQMRLAPDMLPMLVQVQLATDTATTWMSRLAGVDVREWEHSETTLDDVRNRIRRTIRYLRSIDPASINGSEEREIVHPHRFGELRMDGENYLKMMTANLFFHVTIVYALLRHGGVELGKADYLG
jgi:uncharacterized protein